MFIYDIFNVTDADFYNIDVEHDNRKFIDPYLFGYLNHAVAQQAHIVIVDFFETVRQAVFAGDHFRARKLFCDNMVEPKETCLGLTKKGVDGRGLKNLTHYVLGELFKNNAALTHIITRIEDIKLFMPNISHDRVSDITTNVIRKCLINYTAEQCRIYGQPLIMRKTNPYWDVVSSSWVSTYEECYIGPDGKQKLFVPKCFINKGRYNYTNYINTIIVPDYIDVEMKKGGSSLVQKLKDGTERITKKSMRADLTRKKGKLDKVFASEYTMEHPGGVEEFKKILADRMFNGESKK